MKTALTKYPQVSVTAVGRTQSDLAELQTSFGDRVLTVCGDITEKSVLQTVIDQSLKQWGSIDGIVFNAGVLAPVNHLYDQHYDIEEAKRLFDVNYFSIVQFTNMVFTRLGINPSCDEDKMNVVMVSSGASTRALDSWLAYGSSKAAVNMICAHMHQELYPVVHSVSVAPGVVDTQMQQQIRANRNMIPESLKRFVDLHKDGKLLDPMDVAKVYCKLVIEGIPKEVDGKYVRWDDIFSK